MQSKLEETTHRLEEMQQRRKHDKEKLQMQGEKLSKWQGEVRRLNNLVLHNNINSGKFFEVRLPFPLPFRRCQSTFLFLWLDVMIKWHVVCCTINTIRCGRAKHVKAAGLLCLFCALLDMRGKSALADLNVVDVCVA